MAARFQHELETDAQQSLTTSIYITMLMTVTPLVDGTVHFGQSSDLQSQCLGMEMGSKMQERITAATEAWRQRGTTGRSQTQAVRR